VTPEASRTRRRRRRVARRRPRRCSPRRPPASRVSVVSSRSRGGESRSVSPNVTRSVTPTTLPVRSSRRSRSPRSSRRRRRSRVAAVVAVASVCIPKRRRGDTKGPAIGGELVSRTSHRTAYRTPHRTADASATAPNRSNASAATGWFPAAARYAVDDRDREPAGEQGRPGVDRDVPASPRLATHLLADGDPVVREVPRERERDTGGEQRLDRPPQVSGEPDPDHADPAANERIRGTAGATRRGNRPLRPRRAPRRSGRRGTRTAPRPRRRRGSRRLRASADGRRARGRRPHRVIRLGVVGCPPSAHRDHLPVARATATGKDRSPHSVVRIPAPRSSRSRSRRSNATSRVPGVSPAVTSGEGR